MARHTWPQLEETVVRTAILTALLVVLAACGSSPAEDVGSDPSVVASPVAASPTAGAAAGSQALTGVLHGDPGLEGGCVWLDTPDGRVEVIWPDGYQASADPVELRDAAGDVVAGDGDEVTVAAAPASDRVSICQVGEIWTATTVEILGTS